MPWVLTGSHMLLNLVQEDDGVADDHAAQGQDAQVGDEAQGFPKEEHPPGDADKSHGRRNQGQEHERRTAQLEHEQCHDNDDHDRYRHQEVFQGLLAVFQGPVDFDGVAKGHAFPDIGNGVIGFLRRIVGRTGLDAAVDGNGRLQIAAPDEAIFAFIGNVGNLFQRHVAGPPDIDRQALYLRQVIAVAVLKTQLDTDGLVGCVVLCDCGPGQFRIQGLGNIFAGNAHGPQFILVQVDVHDLILLVPVEEDIFRIRVLGNARRNLLGIGLDLIRIVAGYAQHNGIIRRRP